MKIEERLKKSINNNNKNNLDNIFKKIYNDYFKLVFFIISKYVDNDFDIEELVDDVFIKFYKKIFETEISNVKYYLVTSAKNAAINYIKSKKKIENFVYDDNYFIKDISIDSHIQYIELINNIKKILNDFEIDIIFKHLLDDYSFNELATLYNKSIKTIYSTYARSIKKIKKGLRTNEK